MALSEAKYILRGDAMSMIEVMMDIKFKQLIQQDYAHIAQPNGVYARVTRVSGNEYNLKILDESKGVNTNFPEIPRVRSESDFEVGDTVAVMLLYGKLSHVYILGKVI